MDGPRQHREVRLFGLLAMTAAVLLSPGSASPRILEFVEQQVDAGLFGARALAVTEDGTHVFVGGFSTLVFERDRSTGELGFAAATTGSDVMAISPHGRNLYVHNHGPLRVLARESDSGTLAFVEGWDEGMSGIHGL